MVVTLATVVLVAAGVFAIAYVSPRKGQKIEDRIEEIRKKLTGHAKRLPDLFNKLTRKSLKMGSKAVKKSAESGKKSRKKSPF